MNADQIVVLDKGKIVEIGNHQSLVAAKGNYFDSAKSATVGELEVASDKL